MQALTSHGAFNTKVGQCTPVRLSKHSQGLIAQSDQVPRKRRAFRGGLIIKTEESSRAGEEREDETRRANPERGHQVGE